jgi:transposase-like protein
VIINYYKQDWKTKEFKIIETPCPGYIKTEYTCDEPTCLNKDKIHLTTYSSMIRNDKWNNIEHQMCKSCRARKAETLKAGYITYEMFVNELVKEDYIIITTKEEFDSSLRPSATKLLVICNRGHIHNVRWNNWKNKGRRCNDCFKEERYNNSARYTDGFKEYRYQVDKITKRVLKEHINEINIRNYPLGRNKYHIDHRFSVSEGFICGVDPSIIGSKYNLEILSEHDNCSKNNKCSITLEELLNAYNGKN